MLVVVAFLTLTAVASPHGKIQKENDDMPQEYYTVSILFLYNNIIMFYMNCVRTCKHNNQD